MASNPSKPAFPKWARRLIVPGVVALIALSAVNTTFEYVAPFEVGIKQSNYGGGIKQEPLPGGHWYLTGPGVSVHRFPTTLQSIEFAGKASETARENPHVLSAGRIEIDTSDGSKMHADVTVLYRVENAYRVFSEFGPGRTFELNGVVPKAQVVLKENLGKLLAEDFYNQDLRAKQTRAAEEVLRATLEKHGIAVEHVLIRQYYYATEYQKQIEQRKVQDQLVFTQGSRAEATKEDARKRKISAEGEASVAVEKRRGEAEITKISAEADLYSRKKRADGDLLVTLATAKGTELENTAYEGVGSENMVAERMADVLNGLGTVVISDTGKAGAFNPLDLEQMIKMFGGKSGAP